MTNPALRLRFVVVTSAGVALLGSGCGSSPAVTAQPCEKPAPLIGKPDPQAPGYEIEFKDHDAAVRGAARYHLEPPMSKSTEWVDASNGSPALLATIRCDGSVRAVHFVVSARLL